MQYNGPGSQTQHRFQETKHERTQGDCSYVAQKAMLKQSWKRPRRGRGLAQCESLGLCPALLAPQTRRAKCWETQLSTRTPRPTVLLRPPLRRDSRTHSSFLSAWPWLNLQKPHTHKRTQNWHQGPISLWQRNKEVSIDIPESHGMVGQRLHLFTRHREIDKGRERERERDAETQIEASVSFIT